MNGGKVKDKSIWNLFLVLSLCLAWGWVEFHGRGSKTVYERKGWTPENTWVRRFKSDYDIDLIYATPINSRLSIDYDLAPPSEDMLVSKYLAILYEELSKYTPNYLKAMGISTIGVYKNLSYRGQDRAAIYLTSERSMVLDYWIAANNPVFEKHAIHHELFHYLIESTKGYGWDDAAWESLNPPGFVYGNGGKNDRDPLSGVLNHPRSGFIDRYAESAIEEDMAEMDACLYVPEEKSLLDEWRKADPYLERKYKRLLEILEPYQ